MAKSGHALEIQFKPELKAVPCQFPVQSLTFLITNSLQVSNRHETAPVHYNLRVVEMAIASDILAKKLGVWAKARRDSNLQTSSLRSVMDAYCGEWNGHDVKEGSNLVKKMIEAVDAVLSMRDGYTHREAAEELGLTTDEFQRSYLSKLPVKFEKLKLYQRARHVYRESLRVLQTLELLQKKPQPTSDTVYLIRFGQLMNESQADLHHLNESSNDKLNEICSIALANGAFGSRVTGTGWGGSVVHLTTLDKLPAPSHALTEQYYKKEFPGIGHVELTEGNH
ncbi:uncharacterized protein LODBEIA_P27670 [Lodderomyces beijingensis]|uniref:GHMP kinase C-terminal domain-containing protein n=1 Tax=Lodderomyces beijingensis TaxID=1775926 RepID=A0ABP0ZK60_9ASCO